MASEMQKLDLTLDVLRQVSQLLDRIHEISRQILGRGTFPGEEFLARLGSFLALSRSVESLVINDGLASVEAVNLILAKMHEHLTWIENLLVTLDSSS